MKWYSAKMPGHLDDFLYGAGWRTAEGKCRRCRMDRGGAGTVSGGGCAVGAAVFCGNGGVCAGAFAADWLVCGTETVYPGQPAGVGDSYGFDAADFPKRAVRRQGAAGPVPDDSVSGGIDGYGFPGGGAAFYRRSAVYLDGGGSGAVYRIGYVCGERIF